MIKVAWLLSVLIGFTSIAYTLQYVVEPTCFGYSCPVGTSSCKELKQSSRDRLRIETKISCLDVSDSSIKDYYKEERSQLSPHTRYYNTKYESINERAANPYETQALDLTPHYQRPEYHQQRPDYYYQRPDYLK